MQAIAGFLVRDDYAAVPVSRGRAQAPGRAAWGSGEAPADCGGMVRGGRRTRLCTIRRWVVRAGAVMIVAGAVVVASNWRHGGGETGGAVLIGSGVVLAVGVEVAFRRGRSVPPAGGHEQQVIAELFDDLMVGGPSRSSLDVLCERLCRVLHADAVAVFEAVEGSGSLRRLTAVPGGGVAERSGGFDAPPDGSVSPPGAAGTGRMPGGAGPGERDWAVVEDVAAVAAEVVAGSAFPGNEPAEAAARTVELPGLGRRLCRSTVLWHRYGGLAGVVVVVGPESLREPWTALVIALSAERMSVVLDRRQLQQSERRDRLGVEHVRRHLALLVGAGDALAGALRDPEPALQALGNVVVPMFADWFAVDVVAADGSLSRLLVDAEGMQHGPWSEALGAATAHRHPDGDRLVVQVMREGRAEMVVRRPTSGGSHLPKPSHGDTRPTDGVESMLVVPVRVRGAVVGAASFVTGLDRRGYRMSDLQVAEELAARIGVALERVELWHASRRAAHTAEANERRLQAVVEASPLAIVEVDRSGAAVWCNAAARALLRWPPAISGSAGGQGGPGSAGASGPAAGGGLPGVDCLEPEPEVEGDVDTAPVQLVWARACAGEAVVGEVVLAPRTGGGVAQLSVSAAPLRSAGGMLTGALAMVEDVTERQRLVEQFHQAERLGAMARLAGGVAHDFNNLLTVVLGSCETLLDRMTASDPLVEEVRAIRSAGKRAADLTSQLLSVGHRRPLQPVIVDPDAVLQAMEPVVSRVVGADISVERAPSPEPARILVEPAELERAVLNLVLNARDAMDGSGQLRLGSTVRRGASGDGDVVEVWVSDTGSGMDAHTVEHCFEPFFTTKPRGSGTGLGLAGVHASVTQAGGTVSIRTRPDVGTTVTLAFPAVDDESPAGGQDDGCDGDDGADDGEGADLVLVVDDDPDVRRLAVQALVCHGHLVVAASDAAEALHAVALATDRVGLLVTDVAMPGMSGVELAARLVAASPGLPVLYMSGNAGSAGLAAGADVLVKPFTAEEFARRVRRAVGGRGPGAGARVQRER